MNENELPSISNLQVKLSDVYAQCYVKEKRLVYIMNHFEYETHKKTINGRIVESIPNTRDGSLEDVATLKDTLAKFNVTIKERPNQTKEEIFKMAEEEAIADYSGFDFVMYIIMTHGGTGKVLSARDCEYNLETNFIDTILKNKKLTGVPKVFIIQACRGNMETDSHVRRKGPEPSDILKLFSTYEGYLSLRDIHRGTLFIQRLCVRLNELGNTMDLSKIMVKVTGDVTEAVKKYEM